MYKTSGQLKAEAKDSLRGRWTDAVKLNLVPSLLQIASAIFFTLMVAGIVLFVSIFASSNDVSIGNSNRESAIFEGQLGEDLEGAWDKEYDDYKDDYSYYPASVTANVASSYGITPIITFVLSFLTIGISFTFLDVIRKREQQPMEMKDAFRLFNGVDFVPVLLINILTTVFKYLWTFCFVIPVFIKHYSYSQSNFIYKDLSSHKDTRTMGATSFITESRQLMDGHKGRLFWLDVSFLGWRFLSLFTFNIANIWLNPYINTTKAAFYNDLAKDRYLVQEVEEVEDDEWTSF
ncbi:MULTISPECIES: DUF975 family protein [Vagococcus]|uniref:Integral membrane protein n=1 Tax=Vagococcus fluvialis bH819 TaxID=1255619 RepID=A0A1X6WU59_9ENTE|nr:MULTISPECIES: DUF975 family protein [Vagococcus]SLM87156.1 Integral membrane protein [Vagococcus fluvialis bH819]HCM90031.1 DUF975 domain-containing protein [Vagococcus sp.]